MDKPANQCQHSRYTLDRAEQTGRCIDCGAEGRMRFVVGDPVAAEPLFAEIERLRDAALSALFEVELLAGHDDAMTEWREKWALLWALR